jgi:hypothetical protein
MGDLEEYLIDSSAMARRIRAARRNCVMKQPILKSIDPKIGTIIPAVIYGDNPYRRELAVVTPPTIKNIIPPIILTTRTRARIIKILVEVIVRLILFIDSRYSS